MKIKSKKYISESYDRWDLEIEDNHNFVVQDVVVHNSNTSLGYLDGEFFVSSRNHNRQEPIKYIKPSRIKKIITLGFAKPKKIIDHEAKLTDPFWYASTLDSVNNLLTHLHLRNEHKIIILCGEIFGPIQNLSYGSSNQLQFRAFDLYLDNAYVPYDTFAYYCNRFNVPTVPLVYRGTYDFKILKELANQKTRIGSDLNQISEGLVIKSSSESKHPKYGRRCFKLISDEYYIMQYGKNPPTDFEE